MRYAHIAIPDDAIPTAREPVFQHLLTTYASETNKTVTVWEAVPDTLLDFKPHPRVNTIRTILVHQILSERRFFAQFVGLSEPSAESLLPSVESPGTADYIDRYIQFAKARLPQLAEATTAWWMTEMPFFGGLHRQRIWTFWRRVLHTCHHRTQVQTWLRMAEVPVVPPIYGPSGDVRWSEDDPTYSVEAAGRG
jgi:uncharacterized damage-inducible protein DinB